MVGQGRDSEGILREHRESERHRGKFKDPKRYRLMGRKPLTTHLRVEREGVGQGLEPGRRDHAEFVRERGV